MGQIGLVVFNDFPVSLSQPRSYNDEVSVFGQIEFGGLQDMEQPGQVLLEGFNCLFSDFSGQFITELAVINSSVLIRLGDREKSL